MDNNQPAPQRIKYDPSFKDQASAYIEECKTNESQPSVEGFGLKIGVDADTVWSWAKKLKKDDKGNLTQDLARPMFFSVIQEIYKLSKPKEDKLNPKQEMFCQLYAGDTEFFGNGVQTYIEVYEPNQSKPGWYNSACAGASEILSNPKVFNRINDLLQDHGLNDAHVDKQLLFVINQHSDFGSKVAAIREYNKLRARITEKIDHTTKGDKLPTPILAGGSGVSTDNGNP